MPHHHHGEISDSDHELEHASADNLMDYLELIFHIDMGEGHLEHFQGGDLLDFDQLQSHDINPIMGILSADQILCDNAAYRKSALLPYYSRAHIPPEKKSQTLRGPPFIS